LSFLNLLIKEGNHFAESVSAIMLRHREAVLTLHFVVIIAENSTRNVINVQAVKEKKRSMEYMYRWKPNETFNDITLEDLRQATAYSFGRCNEKVELRNYNAYVCVVSPSYR